MSFGNGFKHEDSFEMLDEGYYKAKITAAEVKQGKFGDYIQAEVEVEGHPNCNPHIFLLNDMPQKGYGSLTLEKAKKTWNRTMTTFFANFKITEGDFDTTHWVGKEGEITVREQKKNPQYNEIVPYKVKIVKKAEAKKTAADPTKEEDFPEDIPF